LIWSVGLEEQEIVDLERGAIFGKDEGDGCSVLPGLSERGLDRGVVITERGSGDGEGSAGSSGGHDMGAKRCWRRHEIAPLKICKI
jgi:hypothetical protein